MKKLHASATMILCLLGAAFAQQDFSEYQAAQQYLDSKGEVYFSFDLASPAQVNRFANSLSVDAVKGSKVFAYANRKEFEAFANKNIVYSVETHPGDLLQNPSMAATPEVVRAAWDKYPTYEAYVAMMKDFQTRYPTLCQIVKIGTSIGGRDLLYAKISDNVNTIEGEPRQMWTSAMHGDETTCYVNFLRLIDYLLSNYPTDAQVKRLVDNLEIWICPLENPDATYKTGNSTVAGAIRYNNNGTDLNRHYPLAGQALPANYRQKDPEAAAVIKLTDSLEFTLSANTHGGSELLNYPWDYADIIHPDEKWMIYVYRQWADAVHAINPNILTQQGNGVVRGFVWYQILGSRMDYLTYHRNMREVTFEASTTKLLPEAQFPEFWGYYYKTWLKYMEQSLNGINGDVTSATTGAAIKAKINVLNDDNAQSVWYSKLPSGGFWRPIEAGTWDVEFSAPGYVTYVEKGVKTVNEQATVLHIKLTPVNVKVARGREFQKEDIRVAVEAKSVRIRFTVNSETPSAAIYDFQGKLVKAFPRAGGFGTSELEWNGLDESGRPANNGFYFARVEAGAKNLTRSFVISR